MKNVLVLDWSIKSTKISYFVFDKKTKGSFNFQEVFVSSNNSHSGKDSFFMSVLENNSLRNRALFLNAYFTGANYFKSKSYRIAAKVLVFGQIKFFKSKSKFRIFYSLFKPQKIIIYSALFCGCLKIPKFIILGILKIFTNEVKYFLRYLNNCQIKYVIIRDNGRSNFYFLTYFLPKSIKIINVVYSWDNTCLKYFPTENISHIATWNSNQIKEIQRISNVSPTKMSVIGSRLSDSSYSKYYLTKTNRGKATKKKLLVVGMFNQSLEVMEVLKIKKFIDELSDPLYSKIFYRPHPSALKSKKLFERYQLENLGVEMNSGDKIDFRDYTGIICFPTSMLLEIIISRVPTILYAPRHNEYATDPFTVYQMDHFKPIRESKPLIVCEEFNELKHFLISGIPNQNKLNEKFISQIFPRFESDYSSRIGKVISQTFK